MKKYDPSSIEKKWQKTWEQEKLYVTKDRVAGKENFYKLVEFPYPSGNLHLGHWYSFAVPDIYARYKRMQGYNVLYPIGFDAFGLPAENAAIQRKINPADWTKENIKTMTAQMKSMGTMFDWSRIVSTIDPEYYRWTQWIFLQFYKAGLAYRATTLVNWCPKDKTVLANEQVVEGKCDRCGSAVEQREREQWMYRITKYADQLLEGLDRVDWPEVTKTAQRNWIGKSEGAVIKFSIAPQPPLTVRGGAPAGEIRVEVFTTRPDTLFGATYLVLAPEHELIAKIKNQISNIKEVEEYIEQTKRKTELERQETREKTGVELKGLYAINPANQEKIPVWIADYVISSYGTGAIMAVPAHDERDAEFAKKYGLPIKDAPPFNVKGGGEGIVKKKTLYRLRDWILSRQRYWGTPIPMIKCETCARLPDGQGYQPVPEEDLPVKLPKLDNYLPADDGSSPLARAEKWVKAKCPQCGGEAKRETDTIDTFVDSSWYFLRYTDPDNKKEFASKENMAQWLPVDVYTGGAEHNTMHLLYSRFFIKALHELGLVDFDEPFTMRRNHGIVLGPDGQKMSKSKGNVVDPDQEVAEYGADTVRMYLAFLGPYDTFNGPWEPRAITGIYRFLNRVWRLYQNANIKNQNDNAKLENVLHKVIKKIGEDIEQLHFNTAISELMKLLNEFENQQSAINNQQLQTLLRLLAPFAPHLAEELWHELGHATSIHLEPWPEYDLELIKEEMVTIAVQVNGKTRGVIRLPPATPEEEVVAHARSDDRVKRRLTSPVKKVIFIQDKLINFVL